MADLFCREVTNWDQLPQSDHPWDGSKTLQGFGGLLGEISHNMIFYQELVMAEILSHLVEMNILVNNGTELYTFQPVSRISAINSMNSMAMTACPQARSKRNFAMAVQKRPVNMFRLEPPAPPETVGKICYACL